MHTTKLKPERDRHADTVIVSITRQTRRAIEREARRDSVSLSTVGRRAFERYFAQDHEGEES